MPDPNIAKVKAVLESNFQAFKPSEEDLEYGAESIVLGMYEGLALIRNDNKPARDTATENELRKLQSLCIALDDHIASLRRPAYLALHDQGIDPTKLQNSIRDVANNCAAAWDDAEKGLAVGGRPEGHVATEITNEAAFVFQHFTGQTPTFVTDPASSKISGLWPSMLEAIFEALQIGASVEASIRKHKKLGRKAL